MWAGLLLLVASYGQLLLPRRLFADPVTFYGYPVVPATALGIATALFTLGVIVVGEGVCQRLRAPSLCRLATRDGRTLMRLALAAAAAGLTMELFAQWLGRLWVYPYWTPWSYWLVVVPGFAFYWVSIAESYLAIKAVLDSRAGRAGSPTGPRIDRRLYRALGASGAVLLLVVAGLYARWYAGHGGYAFSATVPMPSAPPYPYVLVAAGGAWLLAEWALHRRGSPSPVSSLLQGYRVPAAAVLGASVLLSLAMESQNAANHYWTYPHLPGPDLPGLGVPVSVFATWPLQYLAFLLLPSLLVPGVAPLFWAGHDEGQHAPRRRRW